MNIINKNLLIPLSLLLCLALFGGCASEEQKCKSAVESYLQKKYPPREFDGKKWPRYIGEKWSDFKSENGTINSGKEYRYKITHEYRAGEAQIYAGIGCYLETFYLTEKFEIVDSEPAFNLLFEETMQNK